MLKKFIAPILIVLTAVSFTACASKPTEASAPVKDITASIVNEVYEADTMSELDDERFPNYYELDLALVDEYSVYIEGSGGFSDETALFKVKEGSSEAVKTAINDRVEQRLNDFVNYPGSHEDEISKLENKTIVEKGNYILLVISDNNTKAEEIFNSYF